MGIVAGDFTDYLIEIAADGDCAAAAGDFVELRGAGDVGDAAAGIGVEGVLGLAETEEEGLSVGELELRETLGEMRESIALAVMEPGG